MTDRKWRLAAHTIPWTKEPGTDVFGMLEEIAGLGYEGVQFMHAVGAFGSEAALAEAMRRLGLGMVSIGGPEETARLGGTIHQVGAPWRAPFGDGPVPDEEYDRFVAACAEAVETARRYGLIPAYHNHLWTIAETEEETDRIVSRVPGLKLCSDTGHWLGADVDPIAITRKYADRLALVHLKDCYKPRFILNKRTPFVPLGQGTLDLAGFLDLLRELDYAGWVVVEDDDPEVPAVQAMRISREALSRLGV